MTKIKIILKILFTITVLYLILNSDNSSISYYIFILILITPFINNIIIRKYHWSKDYFIHPLIFLTEHVEYSKKYDLSQKLLFDKIFEVIDNSNYKVIYVYKNKMEINAITKTTFSSWGENFYIYFHEEKTKTKMIIHSVTVYQITSWGKNQRNINNFINHIDSSLII